VVITWAKKAGECDGERWEEQRGEKRVGVQQTIRVEHRSPPQVRRGSITEKRRGNHGRKRSRRVDWLAGADPTEQYARIPANFWLQFTARPAPRAQMKKIPELAI